MPSASAETKPEGVGSSDASPPVIRKVCSKMPPVAAIPSQMTLTTSPGSFRSLGCAQRFA